MLDHADTLHVHTHFNCDFFGHWLATKVLGHAAHNLLVLCDGLHHVDRNTDGARLVCECTGDGLTDPPRCVGRELVALCPIELIDSAEESEVSLLNEIEECEVWRASHILLCDGHHEAEIGTGKKILCLGITRNNTLCQLTLITCGQERILSDLAEVHLRGIVWRALCGEILL